MIYRAGSAPLHPLRRLNRLRQQLHAPLAEDGGLFHLFPVPGMHEPVVRSNEMLQRRPGGRGQKPVGQLQQVAGPLACCHHRFGYPAAGGYPVASGMPGIEMNPALAGLVAFGPPDPEFGCPSIAHNLEQPRRIRRVRGCDAANDFRQDQPHAVPCLLRRSGLRARDERRKQSGG